MRTTSIPCVSDGSVGKDLNMNSLIDNLLDVNSSKKIVEKSNSVLSDIQQDLESFTFGLSELSLLVDEQSELDERIILLKKCVEDTKKKVDRLMK
jgi:hypothetical protein